MAKFRCRKSPFLHPLSTKSHSEIFTSRTFIAKECFNALQNFQSKYLSLYFFPPATGFNDLFYQMQVYSQRNLKEIISVAERSLSDGLSASKSGSSSHIAVSVRQYINDLENPSFNYVPLFGQETTLQIRTILSCSARAKSNLRLSTLPVTLGKKQSTFSWLCDWLMNSGCTTSDENGEDVKKALNHLEQSSTQLALLFDVSLCHL